MIYLNGHLARPLAAALSCGSRVAVLRVPAAGGDKSGREIARAAAINHQAAAQALAALAGLGFSSGAPGRRRSSGASIGAAGSFPKCLRRCSRREADYADGIATEIKTRLTGKCRAALLTGDAARGRLRPAGLCRWRPWTGGPQKAARRGAARPQGRVVGALGHRTGLAHRLRGRRRHEDRRARRRLAPAPRRGTRLRQRGALTTDQR